MALVVTENGAYDAVNSNPGTAGTTVTPLVPTLWPDPATVGPYSASACPSGVPYTNDTGERLMVTGKSGGLLTVTRACEGTTAKNIVVGWQLFKGWGAQDTRGALSSASRNLLRNPGFWLFQRGNGISVGDGVYGPDGWYSLVQTAAQTSTRVNPTNSPSKSAYGGIWTQPQVASQRHGCAQIVPYERTYPMRGEPIRFEFMISASPFTGNIKYAILEWTGTADAPTKDVILSWASTNYTAGNFFVSTTTNVLAVGTITPSGTPVLASIRATVGTSANNLYVVVWTESVQVTSNLFVTTDAWLVPDTLSAPFTPRPAADELQICQRYFEKSYNVDTALGNVNNNIGISSTNTQAAEASNTLLLNTVFSARKRTTPTMVLYDYAGNTGKITELSTNFTVVTSNVAASVGAIHAGERSFGVAHDPGGNIGGIMHHWTADAELGV